MFQTEPISKLFLTFPKVAQAMWWVGGDKIIRYRKQAFNHDVSVHRICTGSDKIFANYQCLDQRPNTLVPNGHTHDTVITNAQHTR